MYSELLACTLGLQRSEGGEVGGGIYMHMHIQVTFINKTTINVKTQGNRKYGTAFTNQNILTPRQREGKELAECSTLL